MPCVDAMHTVSCGSATLATNSCTGDVSTDSDPFGVSIPSATSCLPDCGDEGEGVR